MPGKDGFAAVSKHEVHARERLPAKLPRLKIGGEGHLFGWDGWSVRLGTKARAQ